MKFQLLKIYYSASVCVGYFFEIISKIDYISKIVLGCPESVFLLQTRLYTNVKPNLSNVVIFFLIEQNGSYVIRQNNIKRKMLCIHYFLIKRKKLFGRPNIFKNRFY